MGIYIILLSVSVFIFIVSIFHEINLSKKLPSNTYEIIDIGNVFDNNSFVTLFVKNIDEDKTETVRLRRIKKYVKGNDIVLHKKIINGKEELIARPNLKKVILQLFFVWVACVIMLVLTYFGSTY